MLSLLPDPIFFPSGLNFTEFIVSLWPVSNYMSFPVSISHSLIILSVLPEPIIFPLGLKSMEIINFEFIESSFISDPLSRFQIRICISYPDVAKNCPSELMKMDEI